MIRDERKKFPVQYYSLPAAAKELNIEKEYLIQWIMEGKIRACLAFYGEEAYGLTSGVVSKECDLTTADEKFQNQNLFTDLNDYYLDYVNEPDLDLCVLNKIFSTEHSKMLIQWSYYDIKHDSEGLRAMTFEAYLRGLWQIKTREKAIEILNDKDGNEDKKNEISVVPYVKDSFYSAKKMEGNSGILMGFTIDAKAKDICISRDDMERLDLYLYKKDLLITPDGESKILETSTTNRKPRNPSKQMNMVVRQLVEADSSLGPKVCSQPYKALEIIDKIRASQGHAPLSIENNTFGDALKIGKELQD